MQVIKPEAEFWGVAPVDLEGSLKLIERAGRVCYKSEEKITETSALPFVKGTLIKRGHLAMVEHSNFVVRADLCQLPPMFRHELAAGLGKYLNATTSCKDSIHIYVGGNLTAWFKQLGPTFLAFDAFAERHKHLQASLQGFFLPFLRKYGPLFSNLSLAFWDKHYSEPAQDVWEVCPADEIPHELQRFTMKFITDRGVTHELVRHRPCSFAQESTRYCDYKGQDVQFIEPWWYSGKPTAKDREKFEIWADAMDTAESFYVHMREAGASPQAARAVLPNSVKTEIVVTADAAEWAWIRKMRQDAAAHPDMQRLMNLVPWDKILEGGDS